MKRIWAFTVQKHNIWRAWILLRDDGRLIAERDTIKNMHAIPDSLHQWCSTQTYPSQLSLITVWFAPPYNISLLAWWTQVALCLDVSSRRSCGETSKAYADTASISAWMRLSNFSIGSYNGNLPTFIPKCNEAPRRLLFPATSGGAPRPLTVSLPYTSLTL